ncbi:cytochrome P450 monooxygenase sdnE [Colletotrichum spaethianum]|uniref:Cytochrome P450 monooxygenase sdnE n=1 Tax=Colletotrichum spaethianum TaxID=700344 RepID=A0AA37LB72_9PEZI|nr:cytochrome P450 monooxygenase sdnE [Colletotrichum spaethianum]GKT41142.1 cytochrome P450 monooxygenase sdnE [Colletotrichum spaethianum]
MGSVAEVVAPVSVLSWRTVSALVVAWIVYQFMRALYNASPLHPLSKIPGPTLAAASYLYEFWFDFVKKGRYTLEIRRMHEVYGPIVRINPDELHCSDPNFTDEIYAINGRKRDKHAFQLKNLPAAQALGIAGTVDHDLHRRRRGAMNKFFSRNQMFKLEPKVHALAQRLCDKLLAGAGDPDKVVPLTEAYSCFTSDVVSDYCFGEAFGFLSQEDWTPNFREAVYGQLNHMFVFKFFPWLKGILLVGPWFKDYLPKDTAMLIDTFNTVIPRHVEQARERKRVGYVDGKGTNVFAELFDSDLPPEEKTTKRLSAEGGVVMIAGTETTSFTLTVITFYLLTKPGILEKLTQELRTVVTDPEHLPSWPTLEVLPYFSAVISEGLRLAPGVASRTSRVATEEDLVYRGKWTPKGSKTEVELNYFIPRGYAVGMSAMVNHFNESYFPNSNEFIPERWMTEDRQQRRELDKAFISFSKGTRKCLGMSLAYAELHLALAAIVLRVVPRMQLYDTTKREIEYDHDLAVPVPVSTRGVRVKIT